VLDRTLAGSIGRALAGGGEDPDAPPPVDLIGVCDEAAPLITAYARMEPAGELPVPEWVGRGAWIDLNVEVLAPVIEGPLLKAGGGLGALGGAARAVVGTVAAAEAGAVTGLLSQRVLGQVEPGLLAAEGHTTRMVLVAPNLAQASTRLEVDPSDFVRWVTVHELTHAVQFSAVPWLKPELERLLRDVVETMNVRLDLRALLRLPRPDDIRALVEVVRRGDLLSAFAGEEMRARLDRVQAMMGLIEGHAEHVMDAVGEDLVDDLDGLRAAMTMRRRERSAVEMLIGRLLGIEAKLRQYEQGKAFCDAVVAEGGRRALRRAWDSPAAVPTVDELAAPERWLARVR